MTITLNGTTGISNDGGYTGDGVSFADTTPSNTLVTTTGCNVGIGTSSPTFTQGSGLFIERSGGTAAIEVNRSDASIAGSVSLLGGSIQNNIYSVGAKPLVLYTNSTERMRIDSSGNLLMGKTSTSNGSIGFYAAGSGSADHGMVNVARPPNTTMIQIVNSTAGTIVGSISQNGTNTTYSTSSDYRLKENIAPMTGALVTVSQLKPCTYTWKSTGEASQGFIAHELQEVVPDCVIGEKDAVNEDGSIKPQGIDTSFLVATLTASIQELKAIVDAQAERISVLENNNVGN
jgi:hypothetical protein